MKDVMNNKDRRELIRLLGLTDEEVVDGVLQFARTLDMSGRKANDLAIAKTLSERI